MNKTLWIEAGTVEAIHDEEMILVKTGDREIIVYSVDSEFCATDGHCTHEQAPLIDGYLDGEIIECPKHNARFHVCTGKALKRPAKEGLRTYQTKVESGRVFIEIPDN